MISIKKREEYYLGKSNGKKILDIRFTGIGGAFDVEEGESSAIFETQSGMKFLIDCGHTSYVYLKKKKIIQEIDKVFITHTHSDHISGLSTLIYDRFFIHNKSTIIECTPDVAIYLKDYLNLTGHPKEMYTLNTEMHIYIEEDALSVTKIDTTAHHWPVNNFPNSGLLFHFETEDDHAVVIYSGDINIPITDLMPPGDYPFVWEKPDNVFIFHDMTDLVHEQSPHCHFSLLEPVYNKFNNLFTYHHSEEQIANINRNLENPKMAGTSMVLQGTSFCIEESLGL